MATALRLVSLALGLGTTLLGCQSRPATASRRQLLMRTWRITARTEQVGTAPATDLLGGELPCWHDNRYALQPQGIYVLQEGATKCNADDPATRSGQWTLTDKEQHLAAIIVFGPPSAGAETRLQGHIDQLTRQQLVLTQLDTLNGVISRTRTTLQAQ